MSDRCQCPEHQSGVCGAKADFQDACKKCKKVICGECGLIGSEIINCWHCVRSIMMDNKHYIYLGDQSE